MDDNLNKNLSGEKEDISGKLPENAEDIQADEVSSDENPDAAELDAELEALRDTFQEKYDETVEEAENGPVIQELEEGKEEEEEDDEDADDEQARNADKAASGKTKKKKSPLKIILITIPVLLVAFIITALASYMVITIKEPNFAEFANHYTSGNASETADEKIEHYESALALADDEESLIAKFAESLCLREQIVTLTYKENGFSSAYSYMKTNMSEEEIASPQTSEFKNIVSVLEKIRNAGLEVFSKVFENVGDASEVPAYEVLSAGLDIPAEAQSEMESVLESVASGYIFNKAAKNISDSLVAVNYYGEAYSALVSLGVDAVKLAEKMAVTLYDNGFIIEAATLITVAVSASEEESADEEFLRVKDAIGVFATYDVKILDIAAEAVENEKTSEADVIALVKEKTEMPDADAGVIAILVNYVFDAINAEQTNNLTEAATCYATLTTVLESLGISDVSVAVKTADIMFTSGNINEVQSLVETTISDEALADATEEEKAIIENIKEAFAALNAVNEVFTPHYSAYYQGGTPIDYDALEAELQEKFGADATDYEKGFVYYVLYFASTCTDRDDIDRLSLVNSMRTYMPDLVFLYGYYYLTEYTAVSDFDSAKACAQELLAVNIADEFANSVISMCCRIEGDYDGAIETALKGIELSGSSLNCAKQLAVAYMLKGDFDSAYGYVTSAYQNSMSVDTCDLVLVFNHLYDGSDETIKAELATLVSEIEQTYTYYSATSYSDTTAILDGSKTLEDVFMAGNYDLTDDQ